RETIATVSLEDLGDSTRFRLQQVGFATEERHAVHESGWTDSLERLQDFLSSQWRDHAEARAAAVTSRGRWCGARLAVADVDDAAAALQELRLLLPRLLRRARGPVRIHAAAWCDVAVRRGRRTAVPHHEGRAVERRASDLLDAPQLVARRSPPRLERGTVGAGAE